MTNAEMALLTAGMTTEDAAAFEAAERATRTAACPPVAEWPSGVLSDLSDAAVEPDHYLDWVVYEGWTKANCIRPHWEPETITSNAATVKTWTEPT